MKLKEKIFNYKQRRLPAREVIFPDFANVRSVLVLFESEWQERNAFVYAIAQKLIDEDKDVVSWGYCDKKETQSPILPHLRVLGRRDFNLFGAPKEEVLHDLQKRHYDLLIDLTQHPSLSLRYLALYARADFKAGLNLGTGIHDLLISTPPQETPDFLFEQIVKYLKMIKPL